MVSCNILTSQEVVDEYQRLRNTRKAIIRPNGKLAYSVSTEIVQRTTYALSSKMNPEMKNRSTRG